MHGLAAMHFDGDFAGSQLAGDLLVQHAGNHQLHHFTFSWRQGIIPAAQFAGLGPLFTMGSPVLRLESALLRFFEQFGSVLRSQFNYFLDERCFLRCIDLGRRSGTRRNRCSQLFEELLQREHSVVS